MGRQSMLEIQKMYVERSEEFFQLESEHGRLLVEHDAAKKLNELLMADSVAKSKEIEELKFQLQCIEWDKQKRQVSADNLLKAM